MFFLTNNIDDSFNFKSYFLRSNEAHEELTEKLYL